MNNTFSSVERGDAPVQARRDDLPLATSVPVWVQACCLLTPPKGVRPEKALAVALALYASPNIGGITRNRLAHRCGNVGKQAYRKITPALDFLVQIGAARIEEQHHAHGRSADVIYVRDLPRSHYVGPRNDAELETALDDLESGIRPGWLFVDITPGQSPSAETGTRGESPSAGTGTRGQKTPGQSPSAETGTRGESPSAGTGTRGQKTPGQSPSAETGTFSDQIFSFGEGGEDLIDDARDRQEPVDASASDEPAEAAQRIVAKLDWQAAADRIGQAIEGVTTDLVAAIATALRSGRCSTTQAEHVATQALAEAKSSPIAYVSRAFSSKLNDHLGRLSAPRIHVEPTVTDVAEELGTVGFDVDDPTVPGACDVPDGCGAPRGAGPVDRELANGEYCSCIRLVHAARRARNAA